MTSIIRHRNVEFVEVVPPPKACRFASRAACWATGW